MSLCYSFNLHTQICIGCLSSPRHQKGHLGGNPGSSLCFSKTSSGKNVLLSMSYVILFTNSRVMGQKQMGSL